ncbi:hypothetical protein CGLO_02768 [Colletotrichum gloeosporioides Cg-14]|uniref:Uncharacterized protein n=1 Tax=Colletotrichum gloeosporioides (strain Cg-14) TaxID=1237896 RepID=T0M020_COLGC|nr:hypothetical protein CGLO_02768 [Colletotrichum gloeosporioides Cg-14]
MANCPSVHGIGVVKGHRNDVATGSENQVWDKGVMGLRGVQVTVEECRNAESKCIYLDDYNQDEVVKDNDYLKIGYIFYKAINKAANARNLVETGEMNSGRTI